MTKYADKTKIVDAKAITDVQLVLDDGSHVSYPYLANNYKTRMYVVPQTGNPTDMPKVDFDAQYTPVA